MSLFHDADNSQYLDDDYFPELIVLADDDDALPIITPLIEEEELCAGGCNRYTSNLEGVCYECQTEAHALGQYDMDGTGWN